MRAGSELSGGLGRSMKGNPKEEYAKRDGNNADEEDDDPVLTGFFLFRDGRS